MPTARPSRDPAPIRSRVYAQLASFFDAASASRPPEDIQAAAAALTKDIEALVPGTLDPQLDDLKAAVGAIPTGFLPGADVSPLLLEFTRLFLGPNRIPAAPYESVHRDPARRVMTEATAAVVESYRKLGVAPAPDAHAPPDSLDSELQFVALLSAESARRRTNRRPREARALVEAEHAFLRDHLARWTPTFARIVQQEARHPLYPALAQLAARFVEIQATQLAAQLAPATGPTRGGRP